MGAQGWGRVGLVTTVTVKRGLSSEVTAWQGERSVGVRVKPLGSALLLPDTAYYFNVFEIHQVSLRSEKRPGSLTHKSQDIRITYQLLCMTSRVDEERFTIN